MRFCESCKLYMLKRSHYQILNGNAFSCDSAWRGLGISLFSGRSMWYAARLGEGGVRRESLDLFMAKAKLHVFRPGILDLHI